MSGRDAPSQAMRISDPRDPDEEQRQRDERRKAGAAMASTAIVQGRQDDLPEVLAALGLLTEVEREGR